MSSRALRRLQEQQGVNADGTAVDAQDDVEADDQSDGQKPLNRFALMQLDDGDDENEANTVMQNQSGGDEQSAVGNSTSKKKKRQKRKKGNKQNNEENEVDKLAAAIENNAEISTTSLAVRQCSTSKDTDIQFCSEAELLLDAESELRQKIGALKVFGGAGGSNAGSKKRTVQVKRRLVQPKRNWPVFNRTGLSMSTVPDSEGPFSAPGQYYTFEHGPAYQAAQRVFWLMVDQMNADGFMQILQEYPYHVDSLLQLSDIARHGDDHAMARDFLERALFGCESAFHSLFTVTQNTCRLDYRQAENRPFFVALFRHMMLCAQRGCNRTALEFAKLIYSLDPAEDNLAVLLLLDYFALRSDQFDFLISVFHSLEATRNLSHLPSYCYSTALAMHLKSQRITDDTAAQELWRNRADDMLCESLLKFPTTLVALLDACSVEPDKAVTSHPLFSQVAEVADAVGLQQLNAVYVERCGEQLWSPVMPWLEEQVHVVIARLDSGDATAKSLAEEWKQRRLKRYLGAPLNIQRHVVMCELRRASALLPPEVRENPIMQFDPLPPTDSRRRYERPERQVGRMDDNYLSAFIRSLLPNFNPEVDLEIPEDEERPANPGGAAVLRDSVQQVVTALRDALRNIEPPAIPRENAEGLEEEEFD